MATKSNKMQRNVSFPPKTLSNETLVCKERGARGIYIVMLSFHRRAKSRENIVLPEPDMEQKV